MRKVIQQCISFVLTFLLFFAIGADNANAQDREVTRTWGLSASVQAGQIDVLVPIWMGDALVLAPGFAINYDENVQTIIGLSVDPRLYLDMSRVAAYIVGRVGVDLIMPSGGGDVTNLEVAIGLGGEYFVNPKFSFAVEGRVVGNIADVSNARTIMVDTQGAVVANVYF